MRLVVAGILAACADPSPSPAPEPSPPPPVAPPVPTRVTAHQTVHWGPLETTDGCFYFSGPDGSDDRLVGTAVIERDGTHVTMRLGGARFEGTYREGQLDLMRISPHSYGGPWLAVERIHGVYNRGAMKARYRYNECELAADCPGRCTLAGTITFEAQ